MERRAWDAAAVGVVAGIYVLSLWLCCEHSLHEVLQVTLPASEYTRNGLFPVAGRDIGPRVAQVDWDGDGRSELLVTDPRAVGRLLVYSGHTSSGHWHQQRLLSINASINLLVALSTPSGPLLVASEGSRESHGQLRALQPARNGHELSRGWSLDLRRLLGTVPCAVHAAGDVVLVAGVAGHEQHSLAAVSAASGKVLWRRTLTATHVSHAGASGSVTELAGLSVHWLGPEDDSLTCAEAGGVCAFVNNAGVLVFGLENGVTLRWEPWRHAPARSAAYFLVDGSLAWVTQLNATTLQWLDARGNITVSIPPVPQPRRRQSSLLPPRELAWPPVLLQRATTSALLLLLRSAVDH